MPSQQVNIIYKHFEVHPRAHRVNRVRYLEALLLEKGYEVISDEDKPVDVLFYSTCCKGYARKRKYKKMLNQHQDAIKIFYTGENVKGYYVPVSVGLFVTLHRVLCKLLGLKWPPFKPSFLTYLFFSLDFLHWVRLKRYGYIPQFAQPDFFDVPYREENNVGHPLFFRYREGDISRLIKKQATAVPEKFCFFAVSNPCNTDRVKFFIKLSKYKKIDSYGAVFNNTGGFNSREAWINDYSSWGENYQRIAGYKFVLCFENSYADNYITEKIIQAVGGGAIPIYRGAPNIGEYFNPRSFINYEDYDCSYEKMIAKVIELDNDDAKYLQMLNTPFLPDNKLPASYLNRDEDKRAFYQSVYEALDKKLRK